MFATILQLAGLAVIVTCIAILSPLAGGAAAGAAIVYVGLAMEGR